MGSGWPRSRESGSEAAGRRARHRADGGDTEALRTVLARAAALLLQQRLAEVIASLDELEEIQADELIAECPRTTSKETPLMA